MRPNTPRRWYLGLFGLFLVVVYSVGCSKDEQGYVENPDYVIPRARLVVLSEDGKRWSPWKDGLGSVGRQASLPINHPPVVATRTATHMQDTDHVIGVVLGEHVRAYPWWVMSSGHVVNDVLGGQPIAVTLCERCSGSSAFLTQLSDKRVLDFRASGLHNGTWYARDHQTGSFWHPFSGSAWLGPLKGTKLTRVRTYLMQWSEWKEAFPDSSVVLGSAEMRRRDHAHNEGEMKFPGDDVALDPKPLQPETPHPLLKTMPQTESVFALRTRQGACKAYPLAALREVGGVVQETFAGEEVVIVLNGPFQVGAYARRHRGEVLEMRVTSRDPLRLVDQRGVAWDAWGQAVGERKEELEVVDGYVTAWYEWLYNCPETQVFRRPP